MATRWDKSEIKARACLCGAISVEGPGFKNHMREVAFKHLFPGIRVQRKCPYWQCDHCVNHWGVDVCGCGSGQPVGACEGECADCKEGTASETLGEKRPGLIEVLTNRGGW